MPYISLDYVRYNNEPLQEYVAIVRNPNQQYLAIKLSDNEDRNSIQHHKYIITHIEAIDIVVRIKQKFREIEHIQFQNDLDNYFNFNPSQLEFVRYTSLSPLQEIEGFNEANIPDYNLGIVVSNSYHLSGQLEIALVYTHPLLDRSFTVFDKWSVADKKDLFRGVSNIIDPHHDNFNNREILKAEIAENVYTQFREALGKLQVFILGARVLTIDEQVIVPVLLDIKNINRSRTSMIANRVRSKKIKTEIDRYEKQIRKMRRQQNHFTYLDFLLLISIKQYSNDNFKKLQEDLTASKKYNDLLIIVKSFRNEIEKEEYEHEQHLAFNNIANLI